MSKKIRKMDVIREIANSVASQLGATVEDHNHYLVVVSRLP